jgi:hypothetical protein
MKKLLTIILILIGPAAFAQDSLKYYNYSRNQVTATGMKVLGGWAITNIGVGAVGWASSGGSAKYFFKMNVLWNVANLGAAVSGFIGTKADKGKILTAGETMKAQQRIERTFLINGGLDLVYIGAGIFIKHRGDQKNFTDLKGYGSSIMLQGAFLLLFDGTMYSAEKHNGNKLRRFLEKNPVTFDGRSIGMTVKI